MSASPQTIALDISAIDGFAKATGYARYARDLILGIHRYASPHLKFLVIGSQPTPHADIASVFQNADRWSYSSATLKTGRGAWLSNSLFLPPIAKKCDLYHSLYFQVPLLAATKTIATVYDLMVELFPEYEAIAHLKEYRWNRWLLKNRADGLVAISNQTRADLITHWKISGEKVRSIPLGTAFTAQATAPTRPAEFTLLSPYNLEPRKNLVPLIEAIALLKQRGTKVQLRLFGKAAWSEEREAKFEANMKKGGVGDQIVRLGILSDDDLAREMSSAHLFAFPSLYEGFGLPALEAMAAGACVLAANRGAIQEVIGDAGVLSDDVGASGWAEKIAVAMRSPQEIAALRIKARARAEEFSLKRMAESTLAYYESLLRS